MALFQKKKIFISYRHNSGQAIVQNLYSSLKSRYDVFFDNHLHAGYFDENLLKKIRQSDYFILVLTPGSLDRCNDPEDWVRREIVCALDNNITIVPVYEQGYTFPANPPEAVAKAINQHGIMIDYNLYDASIERLIKCMTPDEPKDLLLYAVSGIAIVLAAALIMVLLNRNGPPDPTVPPTLSPTTAPTSAPTVPPTAPPTAPPTEEPTEEPTAEPTEEPTVPQTLLLTGQEFGNTMENLCNQGLSAEHFAASGNPHLTNINRIGNCTYWYDAVENNIRLREDDNNPITILEDVNVGYLCVTTDWFYYTLVDNNATLYRAPRLEDNTMGTPQLIADKLSPHNNIMLDETAVYYWREGKGIYMLDFATGQEEHVFSTPVVFTIDTIGMIGDWIYGYNFSSLWRVDVETGALRTILVPSDHFSDFEIVGANACGSWIYFALEDTRIDTVHHCARVYRIRTDGSNLELLFVAEAPNHKFRAITVNPDENLNLAFDCGSGYLFYYIDGTTGEIKNAKYTNVPAYEAELFTTEGNTASNQANGAFVCLYKTTFTYYLDEDVCMINALGDHSIYSINGRIRIKSTVDGEDQYTYLKSNVDCRFLYATADWLYYLLMEDGIGYLYRSHLDLDNHTIEDELLIASNVRPDSGIFITNGWVYYRGVDTGICRVRVNGRDQEVIYPADHINGYRQGRTFEVLNDTLYFYDPDGLHAVSVTENRMYSWFSAADLPGDLRIACAVSDGTNVYFAAGPQAEDGTLMANQVWLVPLGESAAQFLCSLDEDAQIAKLNIVNKETVIKYFKDGQYHLSYFKQDAPGEVIFSYTYPLE